MLNNSKDLKGKDSAKRGREASGASHGAIGNSSTNGNQTATMKEKRLSQHQA